MRHKKLRVYEILQLHREYSIKATVNFKSNFNPRKEIQKTNTMLNKTNKVQLDETKTEIKKTIKTTNDIKMTSCITIYYLEQKITNIK